MSWTQPTCETCYAIHWPGRTPTRLVDDVREIEQCCYCGRQTKSGIYVRDDPATVPFPTERQ